MQRTWVLCITQTSEKIIMAYVVTENCRDCKYTYCAAVCPAEAFREGPDMLLIDAESCINCNACVSECPVDAIYPDYDVPSEMKHWTKFNRENAPLYPMISVQKKPLKGERCIKS